jgi:hypothetical protein
MTNVLVDRHHSGLYHSLQLLAARLGWTLYTPMHHEWWDEGYWSFGRFTYGDDRLAQQFLMHPDVDGEFPKADLINFVSLEHARTLKWDIVMTSLPDNEFGFHRFAKEHGAQFAVQIGNTGQYVNWDLEPLAISSSEMPIQGRGVVYHQEMDPVAYVPPGLGVASFVNCMTSMGYCWDLLEEARARIPVRIFGIDGPDGVVKPYSRLVDIMGSVGWGWHDKAQGDGFGHVIHTWAAVGRPLIGHASHYRGKMAEHLWRDMETCIDLDRHSVAEAVDIIRTISPAEHERMCLAIRAEFDTIDYAAEAESIRDLFAAVLA